jgi:hypothetical protein
MTRLVSCYSEWVSRRVGESVRRVSSWSGSSRRRVVGLVQASKLAKPRHNNRQVQVQVQVRVQVRAQVLRNRLRRRKEVSSAHAERTREGLDD